MFTYGLSKCMNWGDDYTWQSFNEARFEAGEEPYMDTEGEVWCGDVGTTPLEIKCNDQLPESFSSGPTDGAEPEKDEENKWSVSAATSPLSLEAFGYLFVAGYTLAILCWGDLFS